MITGELKNKVDRLWLEFWQGGISNPLVVIEQVTFLMFARMLDINETRDERRTNRSGKAFTQRFNADEQHLRWSQFKHIEDADKLMSVVRDEVFKHFRDHANGNSFGDYMKDARLAIDKPSLLVKAVEMVSALPLETGDSKGDLYEYLLSKLSTAGINGQFRTPRHIIKLMVLLMDIEAHETVVDPSCGTAGFLVGALDELRKKYTSSEGIIEEQVVNEKGLEVTDKNYTGDLLDQEQWAHIKTNMFHGFDFDSTMLRIAAMNLYMHGAEDPDIHYQDSLAQSFAEKFPNSEKEAFDVVLANPPFKGTLDEDTINPPILRMVKTKKTELLFIVQILRMMKDGGRSATVVPQGVLFGASSAHQQVRKLLIERNQLEAVINLPSGVFKPYAGVATAILVFTKGGETDHVWFYNVQDDGFSLDDKRAPKHFDENENPQDFSGDLPQVIKGYRARNKDIANSIENDFSQQSFWVSKEQLAENKYDLSFNKYYKEAYFETQYDDPKEILKQLVKLEAEVHEELRNLESLL
jgi:type I restriction enzyme M protein